MFYLLSRRLRLAYFVPKISSPQVAHQTVDRVIAIDVTVVIGTADEIAGNVEIWPTNGAVAILETAILKTLTVETTTHKIVELITTLATIRDTLQPMLIVIIAIAAIIHVKISVLNVETTTATTTIITTTTTTTTKETLGAAGATREIITQEDIVDELVERILKKLHLFLK